MKKNMVSFLIIIILLVSDHNYIKGEKTNCKFQCSAPHCTTSIQEDKSESYHDGILPIYPFFINI